MEALEQKDLLTAAGINVVSVNGGPDLVVEAKGDGGNDELRAWSIGTASENQGNVLMLINVDEKIDGKFDGNPEFMIARVFNVPTLQANAAALGGQFLGFHLYGMGGHDKIDLTGLKNLENTVLNGGGGNDTLIGGTKSRDAYFGGDGKDVVKNVDYLDIPNTISGGADEDRLYFTGPNGVNYINLDFEHIKGTAKNDTIDSSNFGGPVWVDGYDGNDKLIGTGKNDGLYGGRGNDTINGGGGNDNIFGEAGNDTLHGDDGNDKLFGGDGKDNLNGGNGDDELKGEAGDDVLDGANGNDKLYGGTENDRLIGGAGNDKLDGGAGIDTGDYSGSPAGVEVSLKDGKAENDGYGNKDTLSHVENLYGSAFDDKLTGDSGANKLKGNDGNDLIWGLGGDDHIDGGNGNDRLIGGADDDTIKGGNGDDEIDGDTLMTFQDGDDTIDGGAGNDVIRGWGGDDVLMGGSGDDTLLGGVGYDALMGGHGSDVLNGGKGHDYLEGGFNELVTDYLYFDYDKSASEIKDVAIVGGFAYRDEFIAQVEYDMELIDKGDKAGLPKNPTYGSSKAGGSLGLFDRNEVRDQLDNEPFNPDAYYYLIYSDYDGGDGSNGDVLSFLDSQLR